MADVFISYARADEAIATRLARELELRGLSVWFDHKIAGGAHFSRVIEREIEAASKVIVIWTANSIESEWVLDEASIAKKQAKLVPVNVAGETAPIGFRQLQVIPLDGWLGNKSGPLPEVLVSALSTDDARPVHVADATDGPSSRKFPAKFLVLAAAVLLLFAGAFWILSNRADAPPSGEDGVTVMPFEAAGKTEEEVALAEGVTEELIVRLRQADDLQVVSGLTGAPSEGTVVRGSVRSNGKQLRVFARLETPGGKVLWSDSFEREMTDLFTVQDEIARAVAGALSVSFDVGREATANGGTSNPEAYLAFLEGRAHRLDSDASHPMRLLERAVALDPGYVKALAELTYVYGLALFSIEDTDEGRTLLQQMEKTSARALEERPDLWVAHSARGWYYLAARDFANAEKERAEVEKLISEGDPEPLEILAYYNFNTGRLERGFDLWKRMSLIDPGYRDPDVFDLTLRGRNFDTVIAAAKDLESKGTLDAERAESAYWAFLLGGDTASAIALARKFDLGAVYIGVESPFDPEEFPNLPKPQLRRWAESKFGGGGFSALGTRASIASYKGEADLALSYLELAFERPTMGGYALMWTPALAGARKSGRFATFIKTLGMDQAWRASGDWGDFCRPGKGQSFTCE